MRDTYDMFQTPKRGRFGEQRRGPRERTSPRNTPVELTLTLRRDNPLSIIVSDPAKPGGKWFSLPKSKIEYREIGKGAVEVSMPEWLAINEGLI